ncbi:MAG: hypothetical protein OQJ89_12160 [Kangiellaceae bacterium]|nr:hypothetical protein [Kangiellaceae bacterium]MCW8997160.1 hypothetical protein [Kangiellaceae bacterium]MCW9017714.1 hypothetical protein [Kangiellaceae bacterium]
MPRPSLKAKRTEEILDALEICVIRDGVNGATLEKIADEANMRRSLLRHNIGNREQLIEAFLDRFFESSNQEIEQMFGLLPAENRVKVLLDFLFDEKYANTQLSLLAMALTSAAVTDESINRRLGEWNAHFIKLIANELHQSFKCSSSDDCHAVATGLVGIYFNSESLSVFNGLKNIRCDSKGAAKRLISTLNA